MNTTEMLKKQCKEAEPDKENKANCNILDCKICNLEHLLEKDWFDHLRSEYSKLYFQEIKKHLHKSFNTCPSIEKVFSFSKYFNLTNTKVVIVGQDPYHGVGQANGLAFSVSKGIKAPPSLKNIYKEVLNNFNIESFPLKDVNGDLSSWSEQGVLLINSSLTVEAGRANSHKNFKWYLFTDEIIRQISEKCENVVFLLWGNFSIQKKFLIDSRHYILTSAHPSPFSYNKGFKGSQHFKLTNEFLIKKQKLPINWADVIKIDQQKEKKKSTKKEKFTVKN
ncbi:Uracil-DNA glycosylase [Cucumispora dikerogammari]|nr:Uracil-DNA glycosylase [Cucumispora dikerogammari]